MTDTPFNTQLHVHEIDDLRNYEILNFLEGKSFYSEFYEIKVKKSGLETFDMVKGKFGPDVKFSFYSSSFTVSDADTFMMVNYDTFRDRYANSYAEFSEPTINGRYTFNIYGEDIAKVKALKQFLIETFSPLVTNSIVWSFMGSDGGINSKEISIDHDEPLAKEFYPWLEADSVQDYFKGYLESQESILLLTGVPGTGKTTFIRNMISENSLNADITYDEKIIRSDSFFIRFINDPTRDIMVIEDADDMLYDREKDENFLLKKILNISDGLIKNATKKIIFSTNITDVERIDPALLRPGRCYDVLDFRKLSSGEAEAVVALKGLDKKIKGGKDYTLAEIFARGDKRQKFANKKVGF